MMLVSSYFYLNCGSINSENAGGCLFQRSQYTEKKGGRRSRGKRQCKAVRLEREPGCGTLVPVLQVAQFHGLSLGFQMHPINSPLFISCVNLGFCSLPGRNQQYKKTVTISWPKMALVLAGETGQQDFLTIHFNLENIYVMPLNSPSHLAMPI